MYGSLIIGKIGSLWTWDEKKKGLKSLSSPKKKAKKVVTKPLKITVQDHEKYPLEMKTTQKGMPVFVDHDHFEYLRNGKPKRKNVEDSFTFYWACREAVNQAASKKKPAHEQCKARLVTRGRDFEVVSKTGVHDCKVPW